MIKRTGIQMPVAGMSLAFLMTLQLLGFASASEDEIRPANNETAEELLQLSGLSDQLQSLPEAVIESFEQSIRSGGLDLPFQERDIPYLKSSLSHIFNSEQLHRAVLRQLNAKLDESQLASMTLFYQSPLGRGIREAEMANSILRNRERFSHWHDSSGVRSLSEVRQLAIADLERALRASDAAVDTLISMQVALQIGVTPALPPGQRKSARQLISEAQSHRQALTLAYRQSSLESIAFLYQLQSLEALQAFTAMLKTPAGKRYVHAVNLGLSHGMLDAADALGKSMQPLLVRRLGQGV